MSYLPCAQVRSPTHFERIAQLYSPESAADSVFLELPVDRAQVVSSYSRHRLEMLCPLNCKSAHKVHGMFAIVWNECSLRLAPKTAANNFTTTMISMRKVKKADRGQTPSASLYFGLLRFTYLFTTARSAIASFLRR